MDEEEKLRFLVIIEKLQEKGIGDQSRLDRIKEVLESGHELNKGDKQYLISNFGKSKSSNKQIKLNYKASRLAPYRPFLIVVSVLTVFFIVAGSWAYNTGVEEREGKISPSKINPNITPSKITVSNPNSISSDTQNSFLEKFGELENNREKVELEFSSEESIDNKIWHVYDVIRIEQDSSRSNVGFLMFSTPDGFVETIIFEITHNFDIDEMGIALLLFEKIGKEYIYLWSDEACLNEKYDDRCFYDGYNNKFEHFLNSGADGLTWKVRADIISGVSVGVEREFKEYFTANFHIIG